jgi:hypothetical protein
MVPLGQSFHSSVLGQNLDGPPHHPFCRSTLGLKVLTQAEFDRL